METEFQEQVNFSEREILEALIIVIGGLTSSISVLILLYLAIAVPWIMAALFAIGLTTAYAIKKADNES